MAANDEWEQLRPGQRVVRGESGQFTKTELAPERAAELAKGRTRNKSQRLTEDVESLLTEAGYTPDNCPTSLRLLCEQAAAAGARSVQAIIEYSRQVKRTAGVDIIRPAPGEFCPVCGQVMIGQQQSAILKKLIDYLQAGMSEDESSEFSA